MRVDDLYGTVTATVIAELEKGAAPWAKVWTSPAGGGLPLNCHTNRPYNGINVLILWAASMSRGYPTGEWMTFKQALERKACVKKGERGTHIVLVKRIVGKPDEGADEGDGKTVSMLRSFTVFNRAQIEGLPEIAPMPTRPLDERYEGVGAFVAAANPTVVFGQRDPCYVPSKDEVHMPTREAFKGDEHYFATLLHECVHWTGAKARLDRDLANRFGSRAYAAEELVAELGAAFLCAHLEVQGELRHAGYIQSWLELLKDDPRAIFTAAAKASQAADYLRSFSQGEEEKCAA